MVIASVRIAFERSNGAGVAGAVAGDAFGAAAPAWANKSESAVARKKMRTNMRGDYLRAGAMPAEKIFLLPTAGSVTPLP